MVVNGIHEVLENECRRAMDNNGDILEFKKLELIFSYLNVQNS